MNSVNDEPKIFYHCIFHIATHALFPESFLPNLFAFFSPVVTIGFEALTIVVCFCNCFFVWHMIFVREIVCIAHCTFIQCFMSWGWRLQCTLMHWSQHVSQCCAPTNLFPFLNFCECVNCISIVASFAILVQRVVINGQKQSNCDVCMSVLSHSLAMHWQSTITVAVSKQCKAMFWSKICKILIITPKRRCPKLK